MSNNRSEPSAFAQEIEKFEASHRLLPGYSFRSAGAESLGSVQYLMKGVIGAGDVAFLFGDSGTLKSFVATDIAYHVAAGISWHGHRVNRAGVLVVIAEGQGGYKKRIKAVIHKYEQDDVPIWVVPEPVDLHGDSERLGEWIAHAEDAMGFSIGLILMDTFSLMLGGADESSNADVSRALNNLRKAVSGRSVLLIHHTGHGDKSRERGAYQIRGNADVRILVERDEGGLGNVVTVKNMKSKDDRLFDPINLGYEVIELGVDSDGDPITSLVITETDLKPRAVVKPGSKEMKALEILTDLSRTKTPQLVEWRDECVEKGVLTGTKDANEKAMQRIINSLVKAGRIESGVNRGIYVPTVQGDSL